MPRIEQKTYETEEIKSPALCGNRATVLFLLSIAIGAAPGSWFQSKIVEQRITAKDELIRDYQERLHLIPPEGTTLSRLTNQELKHRALRVAAGVHDLSTGMSKRFMIEWVRRSVNTNMVIGVAKSSRIKNLSLRQPSFS